MSEQAEILKSPEEIAESLLSAIERSKSKLLAKIKKKRKRFVKIAQSLGEDFETLTTRWSTQFVTTTLSLGLFLTIAAPITAASIPKVEVREVLPASLEKENLRQKMTEYLKSLPHRKSVNPNLLANMVSQILGIRVRATLDGKKIPEVAGEIATEKHLALYPGQKLHEHLPNPDDFAKYHWSGMSAKAGAWGYFASDRSTVTEEQILQERYYLVIQTFAADNWAKNWPTLKEWYKFRKLLVFNPENGKAVVGVLADAGPAYYTGRAFGGSPEVMEGLGLTGTKTQGEVLMFFLDDYENKIPLGPVSQ